METKLRVQAWILDCIRDHTSWGSPTHFEIKQACIAVIDDYSREIDCKDIPKSSIKSIIEENEELISTLDKIRKKHFELLEVYKKALKKPKKKNEEDEEDDD